MTSLLRLSSVLLLTVILSLLAGGYAIRTLLATKAAEAAQQQASHAARVAAERIADFTHTRRRLLEAWAASADVDAEMPDQREHAIEALHRYLPEAQTVDLLPAREIEPEIMVRIQDPAANLGWQTELRLDAGQLTLTLSQPIRTAEGRVGGLVVATVDAPRLAFLTDSGNDDVRLTLVPDGETPTLAEDPAAQAAPLAQQAVPGLPWTVFVYSQTNASRFSSGLSPILSWSLLVAAACALLLVATYTSYKMVSLTRHDLGSLARMFQDIRAGAVRVDYPMVLRDFGAIFTQLRDSGRQLVEQQQQFRDLGLTDHLSRVHNRRAFEQRLRKLHDERKSRGPSSVLIIDVDHFKQVNDLFGHDVGDALIIKLADALKKLVRHSDFLARLGGDEFCVIFSYTELHHAVILAERLRRELPREIQLTDDYRHALQWTGGLAVMKPEDANFDDALWRADRALLQAKEAGRNRTLVNDDGAGPDNRR